MVNMLSGCAQRIFMFMGVLPTSMPVYHVGTSYTQKPKEGIGFSGNRVTDSWKLPYECCKLNPGPLEEQSVLLTN